jgi:hypothetical protein
MATPLDIAAHLTLTYESLNNDPSGAAIVAPILDATLQISGLNGVEMLKKRRSLGRSIYGQIKAFPSASQEEVRVLIAKIGQAIAALPDIKVPDSLGIKADPPEIATFITYFDGLNQGATWIGFEEPDSGLMNTLSASVPLTIEQTRYITV